MGVIMFLRVFIVVLDYLVKDLVIFFIGVYEVLMFFSNGFFFFWYEYEFIFYYLEYVIFCLIFVKGV